MDWNNRDRAVLTTTEFYENPQEFLTNLINRISQLELYIQNVEDRLAKLEAIQVPNQVPNQPSQSNG